MSKRNSGILAENIVSAEDASAADGAGVYIWDIATDRVFVDAAAAEAFGFEEVEGKRGMPISRYLERMHPEDLPRVAASINDAIVTGRPYQEEYRVCRPDGSMIEVMALGSCFRNDAGQPFQYAGILFPKEVSPEEETSIRQLCLMAYDLARRDGQTEVAEKLVDILVMLGRQRFEEDPPARRQSRH